MEPIIVRTSLWNTAGRVYMGLALFVAGLVHMYHSGDVWLIILGLLLLSAFPLHLYLASDRSPRIIIDETGINDRTLEVGLIEWPDITHVTPKRAGFSKVICLYLRDESKYIRRLPSAMHTLAEDNAKYGFPAFSLNLAFTDTSRRRILNAIRAKLASQSS